MRYKELLNTNEVLRLLTEQLNFAPKQMGKSIFFLCPFHDDKNPSLSFEPYRKIFTCFSCGFKASDIFDFWTKYKNPNLLNQEKLPESEIQKSLIEISKLGYFPAEKIQKIAQKKEEKKNKVSELFLLVKDIYQHNLLTRAGKAVFNYLQNERKIDRELIKRFSLGCSISNYQLTNLLFQLPKNNSGSDKNSQEHSSKSFFSPNDLLINNLVWITENNRTCDFFSAQQLIIPLTNSEGEIVAFAARKIENKSPEETINSLSKYKYLPNYPSYQKSSLLYNYSIVKKTRSEECYIVEGFFDVISLSKMGIENCVAILGTGLSEEQTKLLIKLKKRIVLFLDGDRAGKEATIKISVSLLFREIDCQVINYPYENDPDEICRQGGKEKILEVLNQRENPYLFILNYYFNQWEVAENPQRISRFIGEIVQIFKKFKSNTHDFLSEKISQLVNWEQKEVENYFVNPDFLTANFQPNSNQYLSGSNYLLFTYFQAVIQFKEKRIIYFCATERTFWLIAITKNYFFQNQTNQKNWQNIYNYYLSSPQFTKFNQENQNAISEPVENKEYTIIDKIFQEIDNIKASSFLVNCKNYYKGILESNCET